jgi:hypothetical protein
MTVLSRLADVRIVRHSGGPRHLPISGSTRKMKKLLTRTTNPLFPNTFENRPHVDSTSHRPRESAIHPQVLPGDTGGPFGRPERAFSQH